MHGTPVTNTSKKKKMKFLNILSVLVFLVSTHSTTDTNRKVYNVYMGSLPEGEYSATVHHIQIINQVINSSFASKSLIQSYKRSFNGFAAYLSQEERERMASFEGVVSVIPSQTLQLQTTRSWDYMGFPRVVDRRPFIESDIIIGVIDSGIWPESESFNDDGFGPVPKKWKGQCAGGKNFTCNKKIIGARTYLGVSARDLNGHGTHVASIAAGNEVKGASYYGLAQGVARGGVPSARIATYKVCEKFCSDVYLLAAFDDAIADGVDIINISIAPDLPLDVFNDPIAIGAYHAMEKGILTVSCAGNSPSGASMFSITSFVPWLLTVAASDIDRRLVDMVLLGDGSVLVGASINAFPSSEGESPLVSGEEVSNNCTETDAKNCKNGCIERSRVHQKVVICNMDSGIEVVTKAGALGCIIPNRGKNFSEVMPLPVVSLSDNDFNLVINYKNSTKKPEVKIFKSEAIRNPAAPLVASSSSRGPSMLMPDFVKPDVTAPGIEILAAFSPLASPSGSFYDKRSVKYNILSGTSVSSPHVATAAAYVKSFHPKWSPSAIKSALMTTARKMDPTHNLYSEFAYGSGHIDPAKAIDPGLVYDTSMDDYHKIWCHVSNSVANFTLLNGTCTPVKLKLTDINYPSMVAHVKLQSTFAVSFLRTVTNVGRANATYVGSVIKGNSKLQYTVEPKRLHFTSHNQKMSFVVTVRGKIESQLTIESASMLWRDESHNVRSPVVVYTGTSTSRGEGASTPPRFLVAFVILLLVVFLY